jgi:hypothetical protein
LHRGLWWGNLKERYILEDAGVDKRKNLKSILKYGIGMVRTEFILLRIMKSGRIL